MRKGMADWLAVVLIIGLIVAIVLLTLYKTLYLAGEKVFSRSECQLSLLSTEKADDVQPICTVKVINPTPLKCSRSFLTVSDAEQKRNNVATKFSQTCTGDTCQKQVVADEMASCWYTFFRGEKVVFQQIEKNEINPAEKDYIRACFICSEIVINTEKDLEGFDEFLKNAQYRQPGTTDTSLTYYQYLAENRNAWCSEDLITEETPTCYDGIAKGNDGWITPYIHGLEGNYADIREDAMNLKTGQKYAVVFIRRGIGTCNPEDEKRTQGGEVTNVVELVPADKINQVCDQVLV